MRWRLAFGSSGRRWWGATRARLFRLALPIVWLVVPQLTLGCLSHEYRIPQNELQRLVQLPPAERGKRVRVVQQLGERRAFPVDQRSAPWAPAQAPLAEAHPGPAYEPPEPVDVSVHLDLSGSWGSGGGRSGDWRGSPGAGSAPPSGRAAATGASPPAKAPPVGVAAPRGAMRASPVGAGASTVTRSGGRAVPAAPSRAVATGAVPAKVARAGAAAGGSGGKSLGEEVAATMIVIGIVLVALAAFAAVGAVATEGVRYDGYVAMSPHQSVYLETPEGSDVPVALGALDAAVIHGASGAIVKDDEGWGLGRAPLDRAGFSFKLDMGALSTTLNDYGVAGVASNIQVGFFPHHRAGLLAGVALAGGHDVDELPFARNTLRAELQVFPLSFGRLHLGAFGHVGTMRTADASGVSHDALATGGGALVELAIFTRLALSLRGDWTTARIGPGQWTPARSLSLGVAIY